MFHIIFGKPVGKESGRHNRMSEFLSFNNSDTLFINLMRCLYTPQETGMNTRIIMVMLLGVLLYGCAATEETEEEVAIEDQGTTLGETGDGTQSYAATEDERAGMSSLNDPNSPLSTRIIYFEYDSSEVKAEYRPVIEAHAAYLVANPNVNVTLEGHADERGSREYNLALGERRAESIKRQMTLLGAGSNQIRLVSYGEERPAVDGHDEYSWSQNRRVEILY